MNGTRRFLVKLSAALLVGVPLTLLPAFFLAWGLFAGIEGLFAPPQVRAVEAGALTLMWSLAGILGILGFWAWIFLARQARQKVRNLIAVTLAAGLASLLSAGLHAQGTEGILFLAGGLVAIGVPVLLLLKPRLSWNPDRPDPA
ncbi:MAG: hypothetical protein IPL06_09065 [Betaproteobacteria bacterium]|nr:hypothetical protein [Betaproteobacteria bacterium]